MKHPRSLRKYLYIVPLAIIALVAAVLGYEFWRDAQTERATTECAIEVFGRDNLTADSVTATSGALDAFDRCVFIKDGPPRSKPEWFPPRFPSKYL